MYSIRGTNDGFRLQWLSGRCVFTSALMYKMEDVLKVPIIDVMVSNDSRSCCGDGSRESKLKSTIHESHF